MFNENNHTLKEILQQPSVWMKTYELVLSQKKAISDFFKKQGITKDSDIILTGAGSSEFVSDALVCIYLKDGFRNTRSIATTDIVSAPEFCLTEGKKLVLSFARSGNSPESLAAYKTVRKFCPGSAHLIITCNGEGELAENATSAEDYVLVLPKETNDVSLAMTSSFSSMMMAGILCKHIATIENDKEKMRSAADFATCFLTEKVFASLEKLTEKPVERAVILGSGPLVGVARECHLKLQELTDGKIMCAYDSFMGLRHGPKAVIKPNTLVVYLLSDDKFTRRYELDLIKQINAEHNPIGEVIVSDLPCDYSERIDLNLNSGAAVDEDNEYKNTAYVLIGQLLGYAFSVRNGFNPDAPSKTHTISRVVSGVKIYDCK